MRVFHKGFRAAEIAHTLAWLVDLALKPWPFFAAVLAGAWGLMTDWSHAVLVGCAAFVATLLAAALVQLRRGRGPVGEGSSPVYLPGKSVVLYMANESAWGEAKARERTQDGAGKNVLLEAFPEFNARASEGRVRVFGMNPQTHEHEEIPMTHWMSYGLDTGAVLRDDDDDGGRTEPKTAWGGYLGKQGYTALRIVAADVFSTWPRRKA